MTDPFPGDVLLPDSAMVYDRTRAIAAPPEAVWPWIVQLGKHRAGWYLPRSFERWLPRRWYASTTIEPQWQHLAVGDRVDDYGRNEHFDVASIDPPRAPMDRSERHGTSFTWALLVTPDPRGGSTVHQRFLGPVRSTGWRRRVIVFGGDILDRATTAPMLVGLAEWAEGRA